MKFRATSDSNRKLNVDWDRINIYVQRWKPGTPFTVEITRKVKKQSDPLRKYYWGVVMPVLLDTLGYERDEADLVHRQLKCVYFNVKPDKRGIYREKDVPAVFADDSDLEVPIKKAFTDWVIRKVAENGGYVPDPNE